MSKEVSFGVEKIEDARLRHYTRRSPKAIESALTRVSASLGVSKVVC
jgi:hypothetical protein